MAAAGDEPAVGFFHFEAHFLAAVVVAAPVVAPPINPVIGGDGAFLCLEDSGATSAVVVVVICAHGYTSVGASVVLSCRLVWPKKLPLTVAVGYGELIL